MQQVRTFTSSVLEPHARGVEFGSRFGAEIARTVAAYRRLFAALAVEPFDVDLGGERAWHAIGALAPVAAEEISGLSLGSGVPLHEIAALNTRTELLAVAGPRAVNECSSVVSLRQGQAPIAVQTWDWYDAMSDNWLRWQIPYPDGRVVSTVTEFGVLGKIGVNSHGVAVLFNMLHHADDATQPPDQTVGFPLHLLSRHILETSRSTADAVAAARSVRTSASSSLTVVDAAGTAVSIELFPGGTGLVEPENGMLARTNHFVSGEGRQGCLARTIGPGSQIRRDKILTSFESGAPGSACDIIEAMHDHDDVGGICAHPDQDVEPPLRHATLATITIGGDPASLEVSSGGPCSRPARTSLRT